MNWLNPVNWAKVAVAKAADAKIDEYINASGAMQAVRFGVNKAVDLATARVDDDKTAKVADALMNAGELLVEIGKAIHPTSVEGKGISFEEMENISHALEKASITIADDSAFLALREKAKAFVREKLGI